MRATIKDIAERVGVSKSLVSMYLNNHPLSARIAEKTKKRIREAVQEMNYQPSQTARALKNGKSKTIGLVIAEISGIYTSFYTQSLMYEALNYNYQLLISLTRFNQEEEKKCLANLINRQTDGTIYSPQLIPDDRIRTLLSGYPILLSNIILPEYNTYTLEQDSALYQALLQMKNAGCRRLCGLFMTSSDHWNSFSEEICRELGMEFSSIQYYQKSAEEIYRQLVSIGPDFALCGSSTIPNKLILFCQENGIRELPRFVYSYTLPNDFIDHDSVFGVIVNPFKPQVKERMARIIEMIEHPETGIRHLTIPTRFLNREELRDYYREQAEDPYYKTIIEERGYVLNRKGCGR